MINHADNSSVLIKEILSSFFEYFNARPGMLGDAVEINAMFYIIDQLYFFDRYDRRIDSQEYSWHAFLTEKKYILEGRHVLKDQLNKNRHDYALLKQLRAEYFSWVEAKALAH